MDVKLSEMQKFGHDNFLFLGSHNSVFFDRKRNSIVLCLTLCVLFINFFAYIYIYIYIYMMHAKTKLG